MTKDRVQRRGNAGSTAGATSGATPGQRPCNGGERHPLYTPCVAPALGGGMHASNQTQERAADSEPINDVKLSPWLIKVLTEITKRTRIEAALIEKEQQKWLQ